MLHVKPMPMLDASSECNVAILTFTVCLTNDVESSSLLIGIAVTKSTTLMHDF